MTTEGYTFLLLGAPDAGGPQPSDQSPSLASQSLPGRPGIVLEGDVWEAVRHRLEPEDLEFLELMKLRSHLRTVLVDSYSVE